MKNCGWCLLVWGLLWVAGCSATPGDESPSPTDGTPSPTATATITDAQISSSSKLRYLPVPGEKPSTPVPEQESLMPDDRTPSTEPTALPSPVVAQTPAGGAPEGKGSSLDLNHDGRLSVAEAEAAMKILDKNHDGVLDREERQAARPFLRETNRQLRLKSMDLDKDGKISKEELKQASAPYDANHDGKMSPEEMKEWRHAWWRQTHQPGSWAKLFPRHDSQGLKSGLIESSPTVSPTP